MERGLEDMSSILKVEDLVKYYGEGENQVRAVDHTSLQIERGKFTAIVGRSGSGKSTLLHLIGGLDRPDSGKVWIDGTDIYSRKDDKLAQFRRKKIGFIFQDFNLIPSLNVWENIVLPLGLDNRKVKPREVEDILKKIGLQDKKDAMPSALSGGQKQRTAIARALAVNPSILICDEATSALDVTVQAQVVKQMMDLRDKMGTAIVIVTHNMGVASKMADYIAVMQNGELKEFGTREQVIYHPENDYTKKLLTVVPKLQGETDGE